MALRRRHGTQALRLIDLTSLVDVTVTLLAFLLLISRVSEEDGIPVQLPAAEQAARVPVGDLEVAILKNGDLVVDGLPASRDQLDARAKGRRKAVIRADRACLHGTVVEIEDRLRKAGVVELYSAVEKPGGKQDW